MTYRRARAMRERLRRYIIPAKAGIQAVTPSAAMFKRQGARSGRDAATHADQCNADGSRVTGPVNATSRSPRSTSLPMWRSSPFIE